MAGRQMKLRRGIINGDGLIIMGSNVFVDHQGQIVIIGILLHILAGKKFRREIAQDQKEQIGTEITQHQFVRPCFMDKF